MTGVSRLPSRPRSPRTLAITPEEEIQVTPPSTTAATGPQPSNRAVAAPGRAFSAKSTAPAGYWVFRLLTRSAAVYSRPSISSSSTTPISAPVETNSVLALSGRRPPCPKASPPSR